MKFFLFFEILVQLTFVTSVDPPKTFRSPIVVGLGAYEAPLYDEGLFDFKSGLIVNETMILSWGVFASDLWVVTQDKYILGNNIESLIDDELTGSQFRKVRNVFNHPCLNSLKLALVELDIPLVYNRYVQPGWFHSIPKSISLESIASFSYVIGWKQNKYLTTLDLVKAVQVTISPNCDPVDENPTICVERVDPKDRQCFFEGAGLTIKDKDHAKAFIAGILYPDQDKCSSKLKFLDLTKLTCSISGEEGTDANCTESNEDAEICDINKDYISPKRDKSRSGSPSDKDEPCPECAYFNNISPTNIYLHPLLYPLPFALSFLFFVLLILNIFWAAE